MTILKLNRTLLLFLIFGFISCNQEVKKDIPNKKTVEVTVQSGTPKLRKTQGSQEGDNVHSSLQDRAGNLWFGTTGEGIYKFDGKLFQQYTESDGLKSNTVFCIFETNDGKIWVGTDNGVSIYDGTSFTDVPIVSPVNSVHNKFYVFSIMQDKNGKMWLATVEGVFTFDGESFTSFTVRKEGRGFMSEKSNVENILQDRSGDIWFGGRVNEGVFRYDGKSISNYPLKKLAGHDWAWPQLQDSRGNLWFSNWGGVYRYDGKSFESFTEFDGLISGAITKVIEDKNGDVWFAGEGGICSYDGETFTHFTTNNETVNNSTWTLLEDRTGNLWMGTRNMGLHRFDGETVTSFSDN